MALTVTHRQENQRNIINVIEHHTMKTNLAKDGNIDGAPGIGRPMNEATEEVSRHHAQHLYEKRNRFSVHEISQETHIQRSKSLANSASGNSPSNDIH